MHRQIFGLYSDRFLRHISMALLAGNSSADVWCMLELDVHRWIKPIDPLPRDVLPLGRIGREFLDFRIICGNHLMARHAEGNAGNSRVWPLSHASVAASTLQVMLEMNTVIESDGLDRRRLQKEKFPDRAEEGLVSRSKDR